MSADTTRREFLFAGASALALSSLSITNAEAFSWQSYGFDPFARSYEEAVRRLPAVLQGPFARAGLSARVARQMLANVRAGHGNPREYAPGITLKVMMSGSGARYNVRTAWRPDFRANAEVWEVYDGSRTWRLVLFLEGRYGESSQARLNACFNWSLEIVPAGCFDFYIEAYDTDNTYLARPVVFTWNFWRPTMSKHELARSRCLASWDRNHVRKSRPRFECHPCVPNWDYGGRGKPDIIIETSVVAGGFLSVPRSLIGSSTELLICSYKEPFNRPNTLGGYGVSLMPSDEFQRYLSQGRNPRTNPIHFRKS